MSTPPSTRSSNPDGPASSALSPRSSVFARKRERPRFVLKLRHKAMLAIVLVVTALLGIMLFSVETIQRRHVVEQVHPELVEVGRAYLKLQDTQFRLLQKIAQNLADAPRMRAALDAVLEGAGPSRPALDKALGGEADVVLPAGLNRQILDQLGEGLATSKADLVMITNRSCRTVARVRRTSEAPICERLPAADEVSAADARALTVRDPRGGQASLTIAPGSLLLCDPSGGLADLVGQRMHDGGPGSPLVFNDPTDDPLEPAAVKYWVIRDQVFQVCAAPLRLEEQGPALGWFAIGFRITDQQMSRVTGVLRQSVFVMKDDQLVASSVQREGASNDAFAVAYRKATWTSATSRTLREHRTAQLQVQGFLYAALELPLGQSGAHQVLLMSLDKALEPFTRLRSQLYGMAVWVMAIALAMSWVLGRGLVRPIETLNGGMRRVADGDLKLQLAVTSDDEIGELAESFNSMVAGLYEREHLTRMVSQSALGRVRQSVEGGDSYQLAKRIEITVLFSDVRDFTSMSEKLSAEQVVQLLNEHFQEIGRIIHSHGGDIDKFIGDAVMATFTGNERRDHAEAAVLAAMEMQDLLRRRNVERRAAGKMPVEIGVGINSGSVVQGSVGFEERVEVAHLGDVVNVASRLEACCKQGKHLRIVISEATYERVRHLVDGELMAESHVKGKKEEVQMYEIRGLASRDGFRAGLSNADPVRRLSSARILARFAEGEEVDHILALLTDPEPEVRTGAASLAPHLTRPAGDIATALTRALEKETEISVAAALLDALARVGDHHQVDLLASFLKDERTLVRAAAVRTLGALGGRGAAPRLAVLLDDPEPTVVSAALMSLLELGRWDVIPKLTAHLTDPLPARRIATVQAVLDAAPVLADRRLGIEIHRRRDPASIWYLDELAQLATVLAARETDIEPVRTAARAAAKRLGGTAGV